MLRATATIGRLQAPLLLQCAPARPYCVCVPLVIYLCTFAHPLLQTYTYTPTNYTLQTCANNRLTFQTNTKLVYFRRLLIVLVLFMKSAGRRTMFLWGAERLDAIILCDVAETEGDTTRTHTHTYTQMHTGPSCHSECLCKSFGFDETTKTCTLFYIGIFLMLTRKTVEHVL